MVEYTGIEKIAVFAYVILPLICLLVNVFIQILSFRMASKKRLLNSIFLGFFAGFCSLIVIEISYLKLFDYFFHYGVTGGITNLIIYVVLGYCYFNFVCLGETARRIRMLIELYQVKTGLTLDEILSRYNAGEIIKKRISRLISNGQLIYKEGRYFIGRPVVLLIANAVILLKLLLLGRDRELRRGPL